MKRLGAAAVLVLLATGVGAAVAASAGRPAPACPSTPDRDGTTMGNLTILIMAENYTATNKQSVPTVMNLARGGDQTDRPLGCYTCSPSLVFGSMYAKAPPDIMANWTYDLHDYLRTAGLLDYREIRDGFARNWWRCNGESFTDLLPLSQSAFLYDAIIDALNVWIHYDDLSGNPPPNDYYYNVDHMNRFRNGTAREIFF
jgi:hypothetical protein